MRSINAKSMMVYLIFLLRPNYRTISRLLSPSIQTGLIWNSPDLIVNSNEDQLDNKVVQASSQTFSIGKTVCKTVHVPGMP